MLRYNVTKDKKIRVIIDTDAACEADDPYAIAPALIVVGFLMFSAITEIKFGDNDLTEAVPAYICIIAMPLFYSISEGISLGMISYTAINLLCGKAKKIPPPLYVLSVLFILKYIFL